MRTSNGLFDFGFWLVLIGALGIALAPFGLRLGWWDFAFAVRKLLGAAIVAGVAGFALCLIAWLLKKSPHAELPAARLYTALTLGALICAYVLLQIKQVLSVPMIHDITTDTLHPPQFVALAGAREAAPNGIEYRAEQVAQKQKTAYPDIAPFISPLAPQALFDKALAAARAAGWHIAGAELAEGRIEATATTALFGFKDDVVIRITATATGSVLDMRSMSRVGVSDLGANAQRIRTFVASLG